MRQKVLPPKTQTAMTLSFMVFLPRRLFVIDLKLSGLFLACHLFVVGSLHFLLAYLICVDCGKVIGVSSAYVFAV